EVAPELVPSWFNLGKACDALLRSEESEAAYARALALDPTQVPARVMRANALRTLGRIDEATAEFRAALERKPDSAEAWAGLIGMKAAPASEDDLDRLARLYRRPDLGEAEHLMIGFAYTLALEAHGRYAEAYEVTSAINALRRTQLTWDAGKVRGVFDAI